MLMLLPMSAHAAVDVSSQLETVGNEAYDVTGAEDLNSIIGTVINTVLGLLGVIFLILLVYAGFLWMTAAGNDDKVTKAKQILTTSIIGLVIVLAAYSIAAFVVEQLASATGG